MEMPRRGGFKVRPVALYKLSISNKNKRRINRLVRSDIWIITGCVLSHLLFIIFMDNIMEEDCIEKPLFVDNFMLVSDDQGRLREMVSNLDQLSKNYDTRISRDKTEVMITS